ncbi:MAG: hypothetical protein QNI84_16815 [Henriciella sp.]|nr:hypothetical protein [Henriciella sp.]
MFATTAKGRNEQRKFLSDIYKAWTIATIGGIVLNIVRSSGADEVQPITLLFAFVFAIGNAILGLRLIGQQEKEE